MWSEMYIGLHVSACFSSPIVMELEFSRQFFEKCSNIKFYADPPSGSLIAPLGLTDGCTDRYDEANSRFSQCANAPKKACEIDILYVSVRASLQCSSSQ